MAWKCFLVEHHDEMVVYLRRYQSSDDDKCSVSGYGHHTASVQVGRAPSIWGQLEDGYIYHTSPEIEPWLIDYRWPTHCACGYEFVEHDARRMDHELIYAAPDGREWEMHKLPIGAMFDGKWGERHADGHSWVVKLPPGNSYDLWNIDHKATSGGYWERHGEAPDLVVTPSIQTGAYHGFLGSNTAPAPGWLSDPL